MRSCGERGSVLVLTLIMLVLVGVAVTVTYTAILSTTRSAYTLLASTQALYAAESGVNEALWRLNLNGKSRQNGSSYIQEWTTVNGINTFTVVEPDLFAVTVSEGSTSYTITSAGHSQGITRTVQFTVSKPVPVTSSVNWVEEFNHKGKVDNQQIPELPQVVLNYSPQYRAGELVVSTDYEGPEPLAAEVVRIKAGVTVKADIFAKGDIFIEDDVTIMGNVISESGSIYTAKRGLIIGSVIAITGDINWEKPGGGHAYGHSLDTEIRGLVYGRYVGFGNNNRIYGAVIGSTVSFNNPKNTVQLVPEYINTGIVQIYLPGMVTRTWKLL